MEFTHIYQTITHIFAYECFQTTQFMYHNTLYSKQAYTSYFILVISVMCSMLMHITENKHRLKPFCTPKYSNICLNLDRIGCIITIIYFLKLWLLSPNFNLMPFIEILVGLIFLSIGEITSNIYLYNITHTIWHFFAFKTLNTILESYI